MPAFWVRTPKSNEMPVAAPGTMRLSKFIAGPTTNVPPPEIPTEKPRAGRKSPPMASRPSHSAAPLAGTVKLPSAMPVNASSCPRHIVGAGPKLNGLG